ncbi:hypothetical protein BpHYR1_029676 [Brachionus plicatilis]|uniref:Uncharacterized protein n=1 Tax=Brachionus plicatilis TaxID=10195 RepID=A0A3M7SCR7_BRAPC|nr:hypothetical protein BpHYR1_029676 [Brachionus plicatilis]
MQTIYMWCLSRGEGFYLNLDILFFERVFWTPLVLNRIFYQLIKDKKVYRRDLVNEIGEVIRLLDELISMQEIRFFVNYWPIWYYFPGCENVSVSLCPYQLIANFTLFV